MPRARAPSDIRPRRLKSAYAEPKKQPVIPNELDDARTFCEALNFHMQRFGDSNATLSNGIKGPIGTLGADTVGSWRSGTRVPTKPESLEMLKMAEVRYDLPDGYFEAKLLAERSPADRAVFAAAASDKRPLRWHLPLDFDSRTPAEQQEILDWIKRSVLVGATEYGRYQREVYRQHFAVRFSELVGTRKYRKPRRPRLIAEGATEQAQIVEAPPLLAQEMADLAKFKTAPFTARGFKRSAAWTLVSFKKQVHNFGLLFGALSASPKSDVRGLGIPIDQLTIGLLVFPAVWDWYLSWRERRRGFFTSSEKMMLEEAAALTNRDYGWLKQSPHLAKRCFAIEGIISSKELARARRNWSKACKDCHEYALQRRRDVLRVSRIHRDKLAPIMPILTAESPLGEYRKITEEILRLLPDERLHPWAAAEAVRSFLMLRIALHTGTRQRNLRELLICPIGQIPKTERYLQQHECGEMRWSEIDSAWEVHIPVIAFKNRNSSFFLKRPYRLILPDLAGLYSMIGAYLQRHRQILLNGFDDPGTFFVASMKHKEKSAAYTQGAFYCEWRLAIQKFGILNPYTGRGAIKGLLPHGPHNIRDVLATHVLKQTGSFELASYAIQGTPKTVAKHYGRFLPFDKSAQAAKVLNEIWK